MQDATKLPVKDTGEVLDAVMLAMPIMIKHLKDGAQLSDIPAILSELSKNEEFKAALEKARDGLGNVMAEVKDVDLGDSIELIGVIVKHLPAILGAMSAKPEGAE